jgi:hypothetical protein
VAGLSTGTRAFSAIATMTMATRPRAERDAQTHGGPQELRRDDRQRGRADSSETVKITISMAGSASEAIINSRLEPMPPKLVPTSSPASAVKKRAPPRRATSTMRSDTRAEQEIGAEGGDQRSAEPDGREGKIRRDAEQPGGRIRHHRLLAQQAPEVAVGLPERRAALAREPRLQEPRDARERRCHRDHQQRMEQLQGRGFKPGCHGSTCICGRSRRDMRRLRVTPTHSGFHCPAALPPGTLGMT